MSYRPLRYEASNFGAFPRRVMQDEQEKLKTHQPSQRQQSKWVPWTDIMFSSAHPARYADGLEEVVVAAVRALAGLAPTAVAL